MGGRALESPAVRSRFHVWALGGALLIAACGDEVTNTPPKVPTSQEVRSFWGLNPGSCWTYRYVTGSGQSYAKIDVKGPDSNIIAGKTVYIQGYTVASAPSTPNELYLDAETAPDLRLARSVEGFGMMRTTKVFETSQPLFSTFKYGSDGTTPELSAQVFETTVTPKVIVGGVSSQGEAERHRWLVTMGMVSAVVHDGSTKTAIELQYTRGAQTATYKLVPGYGFASFTDFEQRSHQVCNARICDAAGTCTGATSCEFNCP